MTALELVQALRGARIVGAMLVEPAPRQIGRTPHELALRLDDDRTLVLTGWDLDWRWQPGSHDYLRGLADVARPALPPIVAGDTIEVLPVPTEEAP